jgi:uncharacterized lipoprotein YmbA
VPTIIHNTRKAEAMDEEEFQKKYFHLRILKSVQEYLKADTNAAAAVYPVRVPEDLLYQLVKTEGPESADQMIHKIFKAGLNAWSEKMYQEVFGSQENLETFIELLKKKNRD